MDDTLVALSALGAWARNRLPDRVVGITGSTGKTSTKDLLAAVLGRGHAVAVSRQSFNNELGVPLTLLNASDDTEVTVVEMGARGAGHISHLCELARPTVGVVTNVGLAHTSMFGSIEAVARAKSELPAALPAGGTAVLNADDDRVAAMKSTTSASVLTYGLEAGDVRAADVSLDGELRPSFRLLTPWGDVDVLLLARGAHQVSNALAAAAAALALDVGVDDVAAGLGAAGAVRLAHGAVPHAGRRDRRQRRVQRQPAVHRSRVARARPDRRPPAHRRARAHARAGRRVGARAPAHRRAGPGARHRRDRVGQRARLRR